MNETAKLTRQFLKASENHDPWVVLKALRATSAIIETDIERTEKNGQKDNWKPDLSKLT